MGVLPLDLVEQDGLEVPVWSTRSSQEKMAVHRAPCLGAETRVFCGVALGCRNKSRALKKMVRSRFWVGDPSLMVVLAWQGSRQLAPGTIRYGVVVDLHLKCTLGCWVCEDKYWLVSFC